MPLSRSATSTPCSLQRPGRLQRGNVGRAARLQGSTFVRHPKESTACWTFVAPGLAPALDSVLQMLAVGLGSDSFAIGWFCRLLKWPSKGDVFEVPSYANPSRHQSWVRLTEAMNSGHYPEDMKAKRVAITGMVEEVLTSHVLQKHRFHLHPCRWVWFQL